MRKLISILSLAVFGVGCYTAETRGLSSTKSMSVQERLSITQDPGDDPTVLTSHLNALLPDEISLSGQVLSPDPSFEPLANELCSPRRSNSHWYDVCGHGYSKFTGDSDIVFDIALDANSRQKLKTALHQDLGCVHAEVIPYGWDEHGRVIFRG